MVLSWMLAADGLLSQLPQQDVPAIYCEVLAAQKRLQRLALLFAAAAVLWGMTVLCQEAGMPLMNHPCKTSSSAAP